LRSERQSRINNNRSTPAGVEGRFKFAVASAQGGDVERSGL
jgi:hypothetical protein